jgi:hypothetical protein
MIVLLKTLRANTSKMKDVFSNDIFHIGFRFTTYDLISNVIHDGKPQQTSAKGDIITAGGHYRIQLIHNV